MNLLTVTIAAQRLGLSRQRVDALIREGRLPAIRLGSIRLIREADLRLVKTRTNGRPKTKRTTTRTGRRTWRLPSDDDDLPSD